MVKLICPGCWIVWYQETLEDVLKAIEELWKPWQKFMTQEQKDTIKSYNNLERLQAILKKQGHIKILCLKCQTAATTQIMTGILMGNP